MSRRPALLALFAALASLALAPAPAQDPAEPASAEEVLAGLDWLEGTWSGAMWGGQFVTHYSSPDSGVLMSHSRLLAEGEVQFYEFEVFEVVEERLHLQPYPGGRPAVGFHLARHDPEQQLLVFENPDKDYPTRIRYQRVSEDELHIVLSDPHGESEQVERFELSR